MKKKLYYQKKATEGLKGGPNYVKRSEMGFIESDLGQWAFPGQPTVINSGSITMKGVGYPVYGIDNFGNSQMMMPGGEYQFPGNRVYELPMGQDGLLVTTKRATGPSTPLQRSEIKLDEYLNYPMDRAKRISENAAPINEDPVDNIRHSVAGLLTADAIKNKFPSYIPIVPELAGFIGSNALGLGHELMTFINPENKASWKVKSREAAEDAYNNFIGSLTSLYPGMSQNDKIEFLKRLSYENKLPDGYGEGNMYFKKKQGGWLDEMQEGGTVSQIWEQTTGTPWSEAKRLGLTTGTRDENLALRSRLIAGEFGKLKAPATETQQVSSSSVNINAPNFNEAFKIAREQLGPNQIFVYNNRRYGTNLKGETFNPSADTLKAAGLDTKQTIKRIEDQNKKVDSPYTSKNTVKLEPEYKDFEEIKKDQLEYNKMSQADRIIAYKNKYKDDKNYVIVDKKKGLLHIYQPGNNKPLYSGPIDLGKTSYELKGPGDERLADYQTVTKMVDVNKDGKITDADKVNGKWQTDWSAGSGTTGAGKYYISNIARISEEPGYEGLPSLNMMNEAQYERFKKTGKIDQISTSFHKGYISDDQNRVSNGCIRCNKTTLENLVNNLEGASEVYILPEDPGNEFIYENGKLNFKVRRPEKYAQYIDSEGRVQKAQGINRGQNTLNYKPIKFVLDQEEFKRRYYNDPIKDLSGNVTAYKDDLEYEKITKPYLQALEENKDKVMKAAQINGDIYNEVAKMAFGILGAETQYGDTHSVIGNVARGLNKLGSKILGYSASSPDYVSKYDSYNQKGESNSVGLTQLRWSELDSHEKNKLKELGITSNADFMDPKKAAIGTALILGIRYNRNLNNTEKENLWQVLPTKWNKGPGYADRVNYNSNLLKVLQKDNYQAPKQVEKKKENVTMSQDLMSYLYPQKKSFIETVKAGAKGKFKEGGWLDKLQNGGEETPTLGPIDLPEIEIQDKADPRWLFNRGNFFGFMPNQYIQNEGNRLPIVTYTEQPYQGQDKGQGTIGVPSTDITKAFRDPETGEINYQKMALASGEGILSSLAGLPQFTRGKGKPSYVNPKKLEYRDPKTGQLIYKLNPEDYQNFQTRKDWDMAMKDMKDYTRQYNNKKLIKGMSPETEGGKSDVVPFNKEVNDLATIMQFGKRSNLKKDDFYTRAEVKELIKQQQKYNKALEDYEKDNPRDPANMVWGAMTGQPDTWMEKFENLNPNLRQPNWKEKMIMSNRDAGLVEKAFPYLPTIRNTPTSKYNLKFYNTQNTIPDILKNYNRIKDDKWHLEKPYEYLKEMRGSQYLSKPLSMEEIDKLSLEQAKQYASQIHNGLRTWYKNQIPGNKDNKQFTGTEAFQELSPNKYGGWLDSYQLKGEVKKPAFLQTGKKDLGTLLQELKPELSNNISRGRPTKENAEYIKRNTVHYDPQSGKMVGPVKEINILPVNKKHLAPASNQGTIELPSTNITKAFVDPNTGLVDYGKMAFAAGEGVLSSFVGSPIGKNIIPAPKLAYNISGNYNKNISDLKYARNWARQYNYNFPKDLNRIAYSDVLTDKSIKGLVNRHNTFVRGVSTNWEEIAKRNPEILTYLESKGVDWKNNPKVAAEYMATHIPISTGYGRSDLNAELFNQGLEGLYTSNSIPTAEGYTYGKGFVVKAKLPTDFSSVNRKYWLLKNNPDYYNSQLPSNNLIKIDGNVMNTADLGYGFSYNRFHQSPQVYKSIVLNDLYSKADKLKYQYKSTINKNPKYSENMKKSYDETIEEINKIEKQNWEPVDVKFDKKLLRTERSNYPSDAYKFLINKEGSSKRLTDYLKNAPYQEKMKEYNKLKESLANSSLDDYQSTMDKMKAIEVEANKIYNQDVQRFMQKHYPDYDPVNRYSHYIHIGYPGQKILEPIKSWEITPEIWKNKSRAHSNEYSKKFTAMKSGGWLDNLNN